MSSEKSTSENPLNTKIYNTLEQATDNIPNHKLGDVCRVVSDNFTFFVLVDDLDGNKFWHPFDGVNVEEALMANRVFKAGQKKLRENPFSPADVEALKNVLLAVNIISQLFEYDKDAIVTLTDNAIVRFSFNMYKRDTKQKDLKIEDLDATSEEFAAYVSATAFMFKEFSDMMDQIRANVEEAKTDIHKVPEGGENGTAVNDAR